MFTAHMNGARLAYVVREIPGKVKRQTHSIGKKGEGIRVVDKEEPGGFMVYFPRGHALRIPDRKTLAHYGLDKKPMVINAQDVLADPNSPLGRIMMAQNEEARAGAMLDMERMVMQMATAKTGPIIMPEQIKEFA